jgi:capsule biosynthesis phosphatase
MRICVDLDGVICQLRKIGEPYEDLAPVEGSVEKISKLKESGHQIIIYTARRMKTHEGDIEKVLADIGRVTLDWLKNHQVPYDEIIFGKPWADVYMDDNALRFEGWEKIADDGNNLPISSERKWRGDE